MSDTRTSSLRERLEITKSRITLAQRVARAFNLIGICMIFLDQANTTPSGLSLLGTILILAANAALATTAAIRNVWSALALRGVSALGAVAFIFYLFINF